MKLESENVGPRAEEVGCVGDARLVASVRRPSLTDNVNSVAVLTVPSSSLI